MNPAPDELAIALIRRATSGRHAALEAVVQLGPPLTQRRYLDALRGFEVFLSMWEPRMEAALPSGLRHWFTSRSRRGLLRRDLDRLDPGRFAHTHVEHLCKQAVSGIEVRSVAGTFGSIYVLEGSALGGQVIARAASVTLGLDATNGAAYFNGFDDRVAARWTAFRVLLEERIGVDPMARQQAGDAARQTFDALITTFTSMCGEHTARCDTGTRNNVLKVDG